MKFEIPNYSAIRYNNTRQHYRGWKMGALDLVMFVITAGVMLYGVWKFLPGAIYLFLPGSVRAHFDTRHAYSQEFLQQGNVNYLVEQLKT